MEELTQNNDILYTKTMSSMDKTSDINMQVQNVAALIEKMVNLIQESIEHANLSAEELADVVTTTNTMADLSAHVEQVLENFKQDFDMVKEETGTIGRNYFPDKPPRLKRLHRSRQSRCCRKKALPL